MNVTLALAVLLMIALGGCATLEPPERQKRAPVEQAEREAPAPVLEPEAPAPVLTRTDSLLIYYTYIKTLSAADLGKELEAMRRAFTQSRSDFNRMRLAMVLSLPTVADYDDRRAIELLEPLMRNSKGPLYGLAQLLGTCLQEQRKLAGDVTSMQHKLEQLKSLERALIQREQGAIKK